MKKIMLAVAIVCATVMANGAAVQWQATANSTYNKQTMYLLTSISETYDSLESFNKNVVDSAEVKKVAATYKISGHEVSDERITKTSNFYLAVFDTSDEKLIHYLDVTSTMQGSVFTPPDSALPAATIAFADVANSTKTAKIGGVTPPPGPTPDVPEPTSGLLLVLGGAALALRRRR